MKSMMLCESLYSDVEVLSDLIKTMEFTDCIYGTEIKDFNYIPNGLDQMFSSILGQLIEVQSNTGLFRVPNQFIHFDEFYEHSLWTCVAAIDDTILKVFEHESGYRTFFDIKGVDMPEFIQENCTDHSKWKPVQTINMRKNDFIFIRPWVWRSYESKLVQTFLLNGSN